MYIYITDQCNQTSCMGQGRCLETINNFTCVCEPGFEGHFCQTGEGNLEAAVPTVSHLSFNLWPFLMRVAMATTSASSISWVVLHLHIRHYDRSLLYPTVVLKPFFAPKAKGCDPLCLPDGFVNCSAVNFTVNSTCRLSCEKGNLLLGSPEVSCGTDRVWTAVWGDDIWSRIWVWSGQRPVCASN